MAFVIMGKMIQDIGEHRYDLTYRLKTIEDEDHILLADRKKRVYLIDGRMPYYKEVREKVCQVQYLFSIDEEAYFASMEEYEDSDSVPLRMTFRSLNEKDAFALATAYHLFSWYASHRYCGICGHELKPYDKERALYCEQCGNIIYPVIAPAVIVAVTDGDRLLMSHYAGRAYKGRALLAGFCEIGESAEETCRREVMEEVGLKIKDITYFASQPWGVDSNLLLGYFAKVDGDTQIRVDRNELADAVWVNREDIEYSPELKSLTATMIEAFRSGRR